MIITRLLYFLLRLIEILFSIILLGLSGYFVSQYRQYDGSAVPGFVFAAVWSAFGLLISIICAIPFMFNFKIYPIDFIIGVGMFGVFGVYVVWLEEYDCGNSYYFLGSASSNTTCATWNVTEVISCLTGLCFLANFALVSLGLSLCSFVALYHCLHSR